MGHEAIPIELAPHATHGALTLAPFTRDTAAAAAATLAAMSPWADYPYPAAALERYFATQEPGAPRYAVVADGALAGALGLRLNWLRGPYIQTLAVFPDHRGAGTGSSLLAWIEREARSAGERNMWVCASAFNEGALHFYERCGFVRTADLPGLVADPVTEILLRKRLVA